MTPQILIILGAILSVLLAINAYFIKQLFNSINQVQVQTAVLVERSDNKEKRIAALEDNNKEIYERLNRIEIKVQ